MDRKRLNSNEQKDFVNLCAAEALLQVDNLKRRIDDEGWEKVHNGLIDLVNDVMSTMPYEQLKSYQKQMKHIAISVGIKNAGVDPDWDGRYLNFSQINELLEGCQDHCLMCDKMPQTMKQCGIRKVYNSLPAESLCEVLSCDE